jgi:Fibronectin type III domain
MNRFYKPTARRTDDFLPRPGKIAGLTMFLGGLLVLVALSPTVQAGSTSFSWNPSPDPIVVGYRIDYGAASGEYTDEISTGSATNATISGLIPGTTYYFAVTTYSSLGTESLLSSEVSYTMPILPGVHLRITPAREFILTVTGLTGHTYDIQVSQNLIDWTIIGTVTLGTGGSLNFTDTNGTGFSRRFYRIRG